MDITHDSLMPFGKYKGIKMTEVPAWWLLYIYDKQVRYRSFGSMAEVMVYININKESLLKRREEEGSPLKS